MMQPVLMVATNTLMTAPTASRQSTPRPPYTATSALSASKRSSGQPPRAIFTWEANQSPNTLALPIPLSARNMFTQVHNCWSIAGSTTTYHHPDHLSNRAETNSSGTRTRTFGQLPFGETWYETGTVDKGKLTGYAHDSGTGETGLDYANFRYYASAQGRFMSADFLGGHPGAPQS